MILMLSLFVGLACGGPTVSWPEAAMLLVHAEWPPEPATSAAAEIRLSPAQWDAIRPLLPDLSTGEKKIWKNAVPRLTLVLLAADGSEVAEGTFEDSGRMRMTFPDHTSAFYAVSPDLQMRLIDIAKSHGQWRD